MTASPTPQPPEGPEGGRSKGLTGRALPVHCVATSDDAAESEQAMIVTFLETLAEVAMAVAKRAFQLPPEGPGE